MAMQTVKNKKVTGGLRLESDLDSGEAMVVCPQCKAIQEIWIQDGILLPTRKFRQIGNNIYHDCGSKLPCRVYRDW
jgi:hypothetical protein